MTDQDNPRKASTTDDAWESLARVAAGAGSPEDRTAAGHLLAGDPRLAHLVGVLEDLVPQAVIAPPAPADVEAALAAVMARRDESSGAPVVSLAEYRSRWRTARMRAAAAVLVVAGAGLIWRTASQGRESAAQATEAHFATVAAAFDSVKLSDGTQVLLGPGSTLTVAAGYGSAMREVRLTGDARFTVAHDASKPFVVRSGTASYRDVGTVFVVSRNGSGSRVAVTEGAVAVTGGASSDSVVLHAGDRAAVAAGGAITVERGGATADDVAWTSGHLVLRDASVAQLVSDVQRWYGMELRVDSALASHTVSATFEKGASAADVARIAAALLGGGVREEGGTYRIVAPPGVAPAR